MVTEVHRGEINASARIIGDISLGIYRSPANALKELVSNAFDVGATEVIINTDYPAFTYVGCYDNGPGIAAEELKKIFSYIGGSDKRLKTDVGLYGRPIIGKIGIGILGMSQISKRFVIISSLAGENTRLEAEINIGEFVSEQAIRTNLGTGKIGNYEIYILPESESEHYTIITTPAGSEALRSELGQGRSARDQFVKVRKEADTFKEFVVNFHNKSASTLNSYESFLWELASLTPIPYFEDGPLKEWEVWDSVKKTLQSYNFKLTTDGYELRKPILLPTWDDLENRGDDYEVYSIDYGDEKSDLQFEGYLYHQRKQIVPSELQGLLIRIRNVGIGGYDKTLLNYPRNIGPMVRGMTGEIYISKGLEEALNIDRNSFNETHEHFRILQQEIFSRIGLPDKPGIAKNVRDRSAKHQEVQRFAKEIWSLGQIVRKASRVCNQELKLIIERGDGAPITVDWDKGEVHANLWHDTVPADLAGKRQFFRVLLCVQFLSKLGAISPNEPDLVGWLRRI
jgi:hypothetical protein